MEQNYISRDFLVTSLNGFVTALKSNLTGAVTDLETKFTLDADGNAVDADGNRVTLVDAINEVLSYVENIAGIIDCSYDEFVAHKDDAVDTDSKVIAKFYRINEDFTYGDGTAFGDGLFHQAGSIIYATSYYIDPSDADPTNPDVVHTYFFDWHLLETAAGTIGNTTTLETDSKVLVPAINEVLMNLKKMDNVEDKTYAQFSANAIKYQVAPTDKYHFRAYRITDGFLWTDGKYYQAGSIIYAIGIKDITTPVVRTVYEWRVLPLEGGNIGNLATLDSRIPTAGANKVDTVVDAMNHMFVDMEVTMEVSATTADGILKTYDFYQGTDEDTRVKIGSIDVPKDMVISNSQVIVADGTEVTGKDEDGFDLHELDLGKRYLELQIANQTYPVYIDVERFMQLYKAEENAEQIQLAIGSDNTISAVPNLNNLHDKLKLADGGDTTAPTLVKALNLAYTRNITTVSTASDASGTLVNDQNLFEYTFKQDGIDIVTVQVPKDLHIISADAIKALGTEVISEDAAGNKTYCTAGSHYLKLNQANASLPIYVDMEPLMRTAEPDATQIQLVINADEIVSATIVAGSVTATELDELLNKKIDFIGYDNSKNDTTPAGNQLTTTAQNLREAVNEHDAEIGDLSTLKTTTKAEIVAALNEIYDNKLQVVTVHPNDLVEGTTLKEPYKSLTPFLYIVPDGIDLVINDYGTYKEGSILMFNMPKIDNDDKTTIRLIYDGNMVGDLSTLTTDAKDTAVAAINELDEHIDTNTELIGDVTTLTTTAKDSLVNAVNEHDAEIGDISTMGTTATDVAGAIAETVASIKERLNIIAVSTYADFQTSYLNDATLAVNSAIVITDDFTLNHVDYRAGTWAYWIEENGGKAWRYMNNGGSGNLYVDCGTTGLPTITSVDDIANIKTNQIYITENADTGHINQYIYLKRSATDSAQNQWLLVASSDDTKGITWIGTYNYIATTTIIDPDTGERTQVVDAWDPTDPTKIAKFDAWVQTTYNRNPETNDLLSLTVDSAYDSQWLYVDGNWREYSSLTKASKAVYGVTEFATVSEYNAGTVTKNADGTFTLEGLVANKSIDPWLLRQILSDLATVENIYTKSQVDAMMAAKTDQAYLTGNYYDKNATDSKLKALQKAYVLKDASPEDMNEEDLEQYYGSLIYYINPDDNTTTTYICDSTGVLENLGASGVSLTGYVETSDAAYHKILTLTSNAQEQIDAKQDTITGAATTITAKDLTASRVVISNTSGKVATSTVQSSELAMLKGISTADENNTIEVRLAALEAGGGGGTAGGGSTSIVFVDSVDEMVSAQTIYRLRNTSGTYAAGYYTTNGSGAYYRIDNEVVSHKINSNEVSESSTLESLGIVKSMTLAQYQALSTAEKMNGCIYCITDDNDTATSLVTSSISGSNVTITPSAAAGITSSNVADAINELGTRVANSGTGTITNVKSISIDGGTQYPMSGTGNVNLQSAVTSVGGNTGAVSLKKISINGGTAQNLVGTGTISITTGGDTTALETRIAALEARVAALEAQMPTFTLNGTTLNITTP